MMKKSNLIIILIISILGIVTMSVATKYEYDKYMEEYNEVIYELIGNIKEKYPEIKERDIAILLNGTKNENTIEKGKEVLEKYGINDKMPTLLNMDNTYRKSVIINSSIILILVLLIIIITILYKYKQKREINKITKYIKEINNKNYELKIKENSEDELTNLRNELYKITLMLREQAENSEKDKLNLAKSLSDISHQIKTPLTSMTIMIDEIKENRNMDEMTKQRFLFEIGRQIDQINFLTISLLKLSKLDAEAVKFDNKKIKLEELIDDIITVLEIPIEIKNVNIVKDIDKNFYIIGDYRWLKEAITNIVKNCIEHTKENKKIYINAKDTNMYLELEIKDEGEGIDSEDLKHIFERFYKGKNSSENSFGIGLALSKSILERQGATINCYSKKDKGTTFKIRWMK